MIEGSREAGGHLAVGEGGDAGRGLAGSLREEVTRAR